MVISPQLATFSRAMEAEKGLPFSMLSDPGNQVARTYGIVYTVPENLKALYLKFGLDVAKHNGDDSWTLPMPARLIIDRSGVIRYAQISPDYTVRPDPQHTVEALKSL